MTRLRYCNAVVDGWYCGLAPGHRGDHGMETDEPQGPSGPSAGEAAVRAFLAPVRAALAAVYGGVPEREGQS